MNAYYDNLASSTSSSSITNRFKNQNGFNNHNSNNMMDNYRNSQYSKVAACVDHIEMYINHKLKELTMSKAIGQQFNYIHSSKLYSGGIVDNNPYNVPRVVEKKILEKPETCYCYRISGLQNNTVDYVKDILIKEIGSEYIHQASTVESSTREIYLDIVVDIIKWCGNTEKYAQDLTQKMETTNQQYRIQTSAGFYNKTRKNRDEESDSSDYESSTDSQNEANDLKSVCLTNWKGIVLELSIVGILLYAFYYIIYHYILSSSSFYFFDVTSTNDVNNNSNTTNMQSPSS